MTLNRTTMFSRAAWGSFFNQYGLQVTSVFFALGIIVSFANLAYAYLVDGRVAGYSLMTLSIFAGMGVRLYGMMRYPKIKT